MKPRLLIAESDECLADVYCRFFCNRGFDVETAGDGLQCLEMLRQVPPHALILEDELPWGGGDGVLALMREEHHLATVPVLVITGDVSVHDNGSARQVVESLGGPPVVACFRKPFRLATLRNALSAEILELATERFLEEAEYLLPLVREERDERLLAR